MYVNKRQLVLGLSVLLFGVGYYFFCRPANQVYFLTIFKLNSSINNSLSNLLGRVGQSLPTFIHPFAFILITSSFFKYQKGWYLPICIFWLSVNLLFEFGQYYKDLAVKLVPDWFVAVPFLENTQNYFLNGQFDYLDVVFILLGSASAYFIIMNGKIRRNASQSEESLNRIHNKKSQV